MDLVFIDIVHPHEQTLKELEKFSPYAKNWIFLHDTIAFPGVLLAIREFLKINSGWMCGEWAHEFGLAMLMRVVDSNG